MLTDTAASLDVFWLARFKALTQVTGSAPEARNMLMAAGASSAALQLTHKTQVGNISTADVDPDLWNSSAAFFSRAGRGPSAYFRIGAVENGFTRVPLRVPIGVTTANATAFIVGEGLPVPLSQITLEKQTLEPVTAAALMVLSQELALNLTGPAQIFVNSSLLGGVSAVVDEKFFEIIDDGAERVFNASGQDEDDILTDLRTALDAVNSVGSARLFWIASQDVAKRLSTFPKLCPNASASGGEVVNLPLLVSSAAEAGSLRLLDASGVAADWGTIDISASRQADIEMADTPTQSALTGVGSSTVSMFTTNGVAVKAVIKFAAEKLRDDCIAKIMNINYGEVVTA